MTFHFKVQVVTPEGTIHGDEGEVEAQSHSEAFLRSYVRTTDKIKQMRRDYKMAPLVIDEITITLSRPDSQG